MPQKPPAAFVIGDPIAHSRSPLLHRGWLMQYGISGTYEPVHVTAQQLPDFVKRLRSGEFVGGNVTIPHKQAIMGFCDEIEPQATRIGAVNTLVVRDGKIIGSNTDWVGFAANLDAQASGWDRPGGGKAIVIGAGGASRAIVMALMARKFGKIIILNRTAVKAEALATAFAQNVDEKEQDEKDQDKKDLSEAAAPTIEGAGLSAFARHAPEASIVVNTSSVGMHGTRFDGLDLDLLPSDCCVTDIVYTPLETPLLAAARARGLKTVDGLGMLLHQAVPGFAAWFGVTPQVTPQLRARVEADLAATATGIANGGRE